MKVRITEPNGEKSGIALMSDGFRLSNGDEITVPDDIGRKWCDLGWAQDVAGEYETKPRDLSPKVIQPTPAG